MGRECAIGEVQDTPVIADIDPGFGNAVNVADRVETPVSAQTADIRSFWSSHELIEEDAAR
jgi:2-methylisocitrate lyase-like PEP mutase family enzyme